MGMGRADMSIPGTVSVARGVQEKQHWSPGPRQVCVGTQGGENGWTHSPRAGQTQHSAVAGPGSTWHTWK